MFNLFKKNTTESNIWKEKAKKRRLEIDALKKRNTELKKSRDIWKSKANKLKESNRSINDFLKKNF